MNRYMWVEHIEEDSTEEVKSTILVPADYSVPVSPYGTCRVVKVSIDCEKFSSQDEAILTQVFEDSKKYRKE